MKGEPGTKDFPNRQWNRMKSRFNWYLIIPKIPTINNIDDELGYVVDD